MSFFVTSTNAFFDLLLHFFVPLSWINSLLSFGFYFFLIRIKNCMEKGFLMQKGHKAAKKSTDKT